MKGARKTNVAEEWKTSKGVRGRRGGGKLTRAVNVDLLFRIQSQKRGDRSTERELAA